jgi:hypothetical protein
MYQPYPFSKRPRKGEYDMDYRIQPFHQFLVAFPKFAKSLSLGSKNVQGSFGTVAAVELRGKGVAV